MSNKAGRILLIPRGRFDANTEYHMLDFVLHMGNSYVAKTTTTGNLPTDTDYFQPMTDMQIDEVTPEMFGAVGDGVTDDTLALQQALAIGKTVKLASATYLISDTLVMHDKQAIIGEGKQSVILVSGTETIGLKIPEDASYCEIKHLLIRGTSFSNYTGSYGIYVEPYVSTSNAYDSLHIIEDVRVRYIDGTGVFLGRNNRGCAITNVGVKYCNGHGIYVEGTDNELSNVGAANCSKHGFYLRQNNRLYSAKAFLCATDTTDSYYSLCLAENFNNVACYDLQQSTYDGMYIGGSGNNVSFASDGVGYQNTDYDAHISVIVLGENAHSNRIVGTVTQGTLNGMFNHLVNAKGNCQNNLIDITYQSTIYYPKDVKKAYGTPLSPNNHYCVNNEEIKADWKYMSVDKNTFQVRYKNTDGTSVVTSATNGTITITDLSTPVNKNSGISIQFDGINNFLQNGNYSNGYVEIKINTNFPIHQGCQFETTLYATFTASGSVDELPSSYSGKVKDINIDYMYKEINNSFVKPSADYATLKSLRFFIINRSGSPIEQSEDFDVSNVEITVEDIKFAYI